MISPVIPLMLASHQTFSPLKAQIFSLSGVSSLAIDEANVPHI